MEKPAFYRGQNEEDAFPLFLFFPPTPRQEGVLEKTLEINTLHLDYIYKGGLFGKWAPKMQTER